MPHQLKPRKYLPLPYCYFPQIFDCKGRLTPRLTVAIGQAIGYSDKATSEWLLSSEKVPEKTKRVIRNFHNAGWADAIEVFFPPERETVCPNCGTPRIELMVQCIGCFRRYDRDFESYQEWRSRLERSPHYQPQ